LTVTLKEIPITCAKRVGSNRHRPAPDGGA
jgi:hypothetical protein